MARRAARSRQPVGQRIADEARQWIGTPFAWGQAAKGAGCDCKGLLSGVAREVGRPEADDFHALLTGYDGYFDPNLLHSGIASLFDQVEDMEPGDVLLCRFNGKPGHLAIYSGEGRAIHTQISSKAHVKETKLAVLFHFYPLHSIWRWRNR